MRNEQEKNYINCEIYQWLLKDFENFLVDRFASLENYNTLYYIEFWTDSLEVYINDRFNCIGPDYSVDTELLYDYTTRCFCFIDIMQYESISFEIFLWCLELAKESQKKTKIQILITNTF